MGKRTLSSWALGMLLLVGCHSQNGTKEVTDSKKDNQNSIQEEVITPKEPDPVYAYGIRIDHKKVDTIKVRRNQTFSDILEPFKVTPQEVHDLVQASKKVFNTRKIGAGKKMLLIRDEDSLAKPTAVVYRPNAIDYVTFQLSDSLAVWKSQLPVDTIRRTRSGVIYHSLSVALEDPLLTNEFADVFNWQIDFGRLQKGDEFKIIYDEYKVGEKVVGIGEIEAGYMKHFGQDNYAFSYTQNDKIDYFDEEGQSIRKAFLKEPLEHSRITSRFSGRRYHPVQKRYKAHLGTDFAAPRGTRIRSVGDGVVVKATYNKYNGNYVKIMHNKTYSTQYLHMSKIASGIKVGTRVKQNQTIGYVGSTGLATGNHVCYRFWKNGRQVDAMRVKLPAAIPIMKEHIDSFKVVADRQKLALDSILIVDTQVPLAVIKQ